MKDLPIIEIGMDSSGCVEMFGDGFGIRFSISTGVYTQVGVSVIVGQYGLSESHIEVDSINDDEDHQFTVHKPEYFDGKNVIKKMKAFIALYEVLEAGKDTLNA